MSNTRIDRTTTNPPSLSHPSKNNRRARRLLVRSIGSLLYHVETRVRRAQYIVQRARQFWRVLGEPNLDKHPPFTQPPAADFMLLIFQPTLASAILFAGRQGMRRACFCDVALFHIQQLLAPIDIKTDCPQSADEFVDALQRVFTEEKVWAIGSEYDWAYTCAGTTAAQVPAQVPALLAAET